MKTIKHELSKMIMIIVITNIIAVALSLVVQNNVIERVVVTTMTSSNTDVFTASDETLSVECDSENECSYAYEIEASIPFYLPYLVYITITSLSLVYGLIKSRQLLNQFEIFKQTSVSSFANMEENQYQYVYRELNEVNLVLNNSISSLRKSQILERELVNFTMHDLKTPLQVIRGNLDLIKLNNNYNDACGNLAAIESGLIDINQIIESSLDLTIQEQLEINFFITILIREYRVVYPEFEFRLNFEQKDVWEVNKVSFRRIITNIIDNALKHQVESNLIIVEITDHKLTVRNQTNIDQTLDFEMLYQTSNGHGLDIINKYCQLNKIMPQVKIENEQFEFILNKQI